MFPSTQKPKVVKLLLQHLRKKRLRSLTLKLPRKLLNKLRKRKQRLLVWSARLKRLRKHAWMLLSPHLIRHKS
jgi:hypothetical protein